MRHHKNRECRTRVHISNEPEVFIPMVLEYLDWRQIRSLRLDVREMESTSDARSLDLRNFQTLDQISATLKQFTCVKHLSLWFNDESLVDGIFQEGFPFS